MSEKPQTGPTITEFANRIRLALSGIEFIGRNGKPYERDYEEDARWFTAYQMAADMHETYTIKDWAYYTYNGMQPLCDEDVKECFYDEHEKVWLWPMREDLIKFFHG